MILTKHDIDRLMAICKLLPEKNIRNLGSVGSIWFNGLRWCAQGDNGVYIEFATENTDPEWPEFVGIEWKLLYEFLKNARLSEMQMEYEPDKLVFKWERGSWAVPIILKEAEPKREIVIGDTIYEGSRYDLKDALHTISWAMEKKVESSFKGVWLDAREYAVATNGLVLACAELPGVSRSGFIHATGVKFLLSYPWTFDNIQVALNAAEEGVIISDNYNRVLTPICFNFPETWHSIAFQERKFKLTFKAQEFIDTFNECAKIVKTINGAVLLRSVNETTIDITYLDECWNTRGNTQISVSSYDVDKLEQICFNPELFAKWLKLIPKDAEFIFLEYSDSYSSIKISHDSLNRDFVVVMPIRYQPPQN